MLAQVDMSLSSASLPTGVNVISGGSLRLGIASSDTQPVSGTMTVQGVSNDIPLAVTTSAPSYMTGLHVIPGGGAVMMAGGRDDRGYSHALLLDSTGRVLCAPSSNVGDAFNRQIADAEHEYLVGEIKVVGAEARVVQTQVTQMREEMLQAHRAQEKLLSAKVGQSEWRYDSTSALMGGGAAFILFAAMVVGLLRRGAK